MNAILFLASYDTRDTARKVRKVLRWATFRECLKRIFKGASGRQGKGNPSETMGYENGMIRMLRKGKWVGKECEDFRADSPAEVVVEGSHDCMWGKASPREVACAVSVRESRGAIDG